MLNTAKLEARRPDAVGVGSGALGASPRIVRPTLPSCCKDVMGPVPSARCMNPCPKAAFRLSMNTLGGQGLPRFAFKCAYIDETVVFGSVSLVHASGRAEGRRSIAANGAGGRYRIASGSK